MFIIFLTVSKPNVARQTSRKRLRSVRKRRITSTSSSVGDIPKGNIREWDEDDKDEKEEEEDLPPVSLGRVFALNRPETCFIISECYISR